MPGYLQAFSIFCGVLLLFHELLLTQTKEKGRAGTTIAASAPCGTCMQTLRPGNEASWGERCVVFTVVHLILTNCTWPVLSGWWGTKARGVSHRHTWSQSTPSEWQVSLIVDTYSTIISSEFSMVDSIAQDVVAATKFRARWHDTVPAGSYAACEFTRDNWVGLAMHQRNPRDVDHK